MDTFGLVIGIALITVALWLFYTVGSFFIIFLKCWVGAVFILWGIPFIINSIFESEG
jgi:hypothetical protein